METLSIASNVIGLIVRGKKNEKHNPDKMAQHADCLLPGGGPVGYFGEGGDSSSGSSGPSIGSIIPSSINGPSLSLNNSGLNMKGNVYYHADFLKKRPHYVNLSIAKKYKVLSTVLLLETTKTQADLFSQYWENLNLNPGTFNLLGGNCSSKASSAFVAANIVASGIPGIDTPNNLFKQLRAKHSGRMKIYSGHIGARSIPGEKYDLVID